MIKAWLLFLLGTIAFFLYRYIRRDDKSKALSVRYWIKDNWQEFLLCLIFDFAAMIVLLDNSTIVDLSKLWSFLPADVTVSTKLVLSFIIGYGGGWGIYNMLKKKVQYEIKKND